MATTIKKPNLEGLDTSMEKMLGKELDNIPTLTLPSTPLSEERKILATLICGSISDYQNTLGKCISEYDMKLPPRYDPNVFTAFVYDGKNIYLTNPSDNPVNKVTSPSEFFKFIQSQDEVIEIRLDKNTISFKGLVFELTGVNIKILNNDIVISETKYGDK